MSNCIITIGRQYGAGGREIAEKLAKQLQIPLYDRKLVAFISAHLEKGVSLDELDLTYDNLYGSVSPYETMFADLNVEDDNYLFTPQSKAIKALAEKNSGIFVGRCANFILKDVKNAHHFFICADDEFRKIRGTNVYHKDLATLKKEDARMLYSDAVGVSFSAWNGEAWADEYQGALPSALKIEIETKEGVHVYKEWLPALTK